MVEGKGRDLGEENEGRRFGEKTNVRAIADSNCSSGNGQ